MPSDMRRQRPFARFRSLVGPVFPGRPMAVRRLFRIRRRGTTTVEAAFVLPIFFTFLLGLFEICYAQMVSNMLRSACSKGARYASVDGVTNAETVAFMRAYLASAMDSTKVTISIKDVSSLDENGSVPTTTAQVSALPDANLELIDDRTLFLVHARTNYSDVAVIKVPFIQNIPLAGFAISRHE